MGFSHDKTQVVLITNGEFPNWGKEHNIPNVEANAKRLKESLVENIGIPPNNIYSFSNQKAPEILVKFQKIIKACSGIGSTLIVYYAGHGLPIANKGLYWATFDTEIEDTDLVYSTAIRTKDINEMLESDCNAERKILIADCCYAADFLDGKQGDLPGFLEKNVREIKGTFYMFSSNADSESTFPVDKTDEPTFFTDALILSIKEGDEPDREYCTVGQLFTKVVKNIETLKIKVNKAIPEPDKRINGNAEEYILYKNPNYQDLAEQELKIILYNPNRLKLFTWLQNNPNHSGRKEALYALKAYDSAEAEIKNVKLLPDDQRSSVLLELIEKNFDRKELMLMAMQIYSAEKGLSAKPELENSKSNTDSIRNESEPKMNAGARSA